MSVLDDQARLRPFLLPGERLLWTGRPQLSFALGDLDLPRVPAAIVCFAFGSYLYWAGGRIAGMEAAEAFGFLTPIVLLAAACLWVLLRPWRFRGLLYAVTSQRVLILGRKGRSVIESHDLAWLPIFALEQDETHGTIFIEEPPEPEGFFASVSSRTQSIEGGFAFVRIERPQQVYDLIAREVRNRRAELNRDLPVDRLTA